MISPNNYCDLYVADDFLAIIRTQNFIFKVYFPPVLITPDTTHQIKGSFDYLEVYKPHLVIFNKIIKGQIEIKLKDTIYRHNKIDITFKELTNEQLDQLEKIKNW